MKSNDVINKEVNKHYFEKRVSWMLTVLLGLPLLTNVFGGISNILFGVSGTFTIYIYGIISVLFIRNYLELRIKVNIRVVLSCLICTILILLNYLLIHESRNFFRINYIDIGIILLLYIPTGYLFSRLNEYKYFWKYLRYLSLITLPLILIGIYILKLENFLHYMHISNIILPAMLGSYYFFRNDGKWRYLALFISYFIIQLSHGGRMSLLSSVVFIFMYEHLAYSNKKVKFIIHILLLIISVTILIFADRIPYYIIKLASFIGIEDNRTLLSIGNHTFFKSSTRESIYILAIQEIKNMKLSIYGLFGDRIALSKYYSDIPYVHNIFLELILSFGLFFGLFLSLLLVYRIVFVFLKKRNVQFSIILAYFICLIFLRLLVSSSFIIEGQFFVLIFLLSNKKNLVNLRL